MDKGFNFDEKAFAALIHDLRAPLAALNFYAKALQKGDIPSEEREKYLKLLVAESDRLLSATEELYAESDAPLKNVPFAFGECARLVLLSNAPRIEEKALNVETEIADLVADGDRDCVLRAMGNLTENAVKYTDRGGSIKIKVFELDGSARFEIFNSTAIDDRDAEKLFMPFYRGRSAGEKGSGLGLYSAKRQLERLGSVLELIRGEGTVFAFSLPIKNN